MGQGPSWRRYAVRESSFMPMALGSTGQKYFSSAGVFGRNFPLLYLAVVIGCVVLLLDIGM